MVCKRNSGTPIAFNWLIVSGKKWKARKEHDRYVGNAPVLVEGRRKPLGAKVLIWRNTGVQEIQTLH